MWKPSYLKNSKTLSLWIIALLVIIIIIIIPSCSSQVSLGRFIYNHHGLQGEVIVLNDRQYMIKGFSYDGQGPAVWHSGMRKGTVGVYSEGAYAFKNEQNNCNRLSRRYRNENVVITLPDNLSITRDIETISVYCYRFCHNFGHVKVPRNLRVPSAPRNLKRNGGSCRPNYKTCSKDGTRDNAVCTDRRGREATCPVQGGGGGSSSRSSSSSSNNNNRALALPPPNRFRNNNNSGPIRIGRFTSHENGVVGEVFVLNDKQFRLRGFSYNGARGKNTYFLVMERGVAGVYSVKGHASPDDRGRCNGLRSYRNEDVTITLPDGVSVRDVGALAVYDYQRCVNFGHVRVPTEIGNSVGRGSSRSSGNVCLPYFRPCSRRETRNNGVCRSRRSGGGEYTC